MCGGFIEMQSRRAPRLHEEMKQNIPHATAEGGLISCSSPRGQKPAPAGLAIVAALEAELVQSGGTTSRPKAAESAPSTTSSLPIPISSSSTCDDIRKEYKFPAYCSSHDHDYNITIDHPGGAQKSIFSTSLSPPCATSNYIMSCNLYTDLYDDFLCACFSCKRPLAPGKDIYMYRGDRAFCSTECRYKHIVADESLPCTIQINQQCVQASSPTKQANFTPPVAIAILV